MKTSLEELAAEKGVLLADGAIGTNLFKAGLETGYPPELWNVERPEAITALYLQFIDAGSDIILTNSFGGTSFRLKLHQNETRVAELNLAAAALARQVVDAAARPVLVAGSIGPTGELFAPLGMLTDIDAEAAFSEQAGALAKGGVDMLWIETMSSLEEVRAAAIAAKKTGLPVMATMTFDTAGRSMMGIKPGDYSDFAAEIELQGFGANCGIGPAELIDSVSYFDSRQQDRFVIAKGNCGIPAYVDGEIHYHGTPELMAEYAVIARDLGVRIIGGCCGTSPEHIRAMRTALDSVQKSPSPSKEEIEKRLGVAWKDLQQTPSANSPDGRDRRRRRTGRNRPAS